MNSRESSSIIVNRKDRIDKILSQSRECWDEKRKCEYHCKKKVSFTKKRHSSNRSEGKSLQYPKFTELTSKTFRIRYDKQLSAAAKLILNSFQNKYIYYAIDDLLYLLKSVPTEHEDLLSILYSPIISLQNNFSINFFDIWIDEIYIAELPKFNKFLKNSSSNVYPSHYITIKVLYKTKVPIKKIDSLW
jgi:hypothetical protein